MNQGLGVGLSSQFEVLVVEEEGNLSINGCSRARRFITVTPVLLPVEIVCRFSGTELFRKQK